MIYKTIDLCAGIGGIRRGFELTGSFQNVRSAEIDESAAKTLVAKEREVMHIIIASASDNIFFIILPLSLNQ